MLNWVLIQMSLLKELRINRLSKMNQTSYNSLNIEWDSLVWDWIIAASINHPNKSTQLNSNQVHWFWHIDILSTFHNWLQRSDM